MLWAGRSSENAGDLEFAGQPSAVRRRAAEVLPCASLSTPLPPQLRPVVQPFPDLAFKSAFGRIVKGLVAERFREIVLAGEGFRRIVIVFVVCTVAFSLHQVGW